MLKYLVTFTLLLPLAATAQDPVKDMPKGLYKIDPTHASLTWKVSHMGLSNYTARFAKFDADLNFDPISPEKSTLSVTVDPTSIRTDYPNKQEKDFDKKLVEDESWFNSNAYPVITFKSTAINVTGENKGTITGDLTLLGQTKPVTLTAAFNGAYVKQQFTQKPALGFSAHGTLKRSDWGFDTYVPTIGDEVELLIEAEFTKAD